MASRAPLPTTGPGFTFSPWNWRGEDLSGRRKRGGIPVVESIGIAKQIAEGLEEAQEKAVVVVGHEIFCGDGENMMAVPYGGSEDTAVIGEPWPSSRMSTTWDGCVTIASYDVTKDGRFILLRRDAKGAGRRRQAPCRPRSPRLRPS